MTTRAAKESAMRKLTPFVSGAVGFAITVIAILVHGAVTGAPLFA